MRGLQLAIAAVALVGSLALAAKRARTADAAADPPPPPAPVQRVTAAARGR